MNEPNEPIEIAGPNTGGWHFTQISDWIALHPDLKDGAFRLYVILRSLVSEKQDEKVRVLSHDQIAFLAVGKNGKPLSASAVKGLLRNLHEVGLVDNPDGKRIVTSSGNGGIETRRRYRLVDWPDQTTYLGWRNARNKLDSYSPEWRDSRCDTAPGALVGQKNDQRDDQRRNTKPAGQLVGQKSDLLGQKSAQRRQKSVRREASTSGDAAPNKSLEEASRTRSSSVEVEGITHEAATPAPERKKRDSPEEIIKTRLAGEQCTHDEAKAVVDYIEHQGDNGNPIRRIIPWVTNRPDRDLQRDLAHVRRYASAPPPGTLCSEHSLSLASGKCASCEGDMNTGDFEVVRRILARDGAGARPDLARRLGTPQTESGGHVPYRNPADQSVYDEPLYVPTAPTDFSGDF